MPDKDVLIKWALSGELPSPVDLEQIIKEDKPKKIKFHKDPKPDNRQLTVVLSDIHFPKHDPVVWDLALQVIADLKPDGVWLLGDILDLECLGRYEKSSDRRFTLRQELAVGNKGLDELSEAIGNRPVDLKLVDGNHEDRVARYIASGRCPSELSDMIQSLPEALYLKERGYDYVSPDDQPLQVGKLAVFHGEWYGKNHAAKHADELASNCIYGHTHRPQIYSKQTMMGPIVSVGLPCMRKLRAEWKHQRRKEFTGWLSGFTVLEWVEDFAHARFLLAIDDKVVWNRKVYHGKKH